MDNTLSTFSVDDDGLPVPALTSTLLACLEQILLGDNRQRELTQDTDSYPEASDISQTWMPGKATEIMNRFQRRTPSTTNANGNSIETPSPLPPVPLFQTGIPGSICQNSIYLPRTERNSTLSTSSANGDVKDTLMMPPPLLLFQTGISRSTLPKPTYLPMERSYNISENNNNGTQSGDPLRRPFRPPSRKLPTESAPPYLNNQEEIPAKSAFKSAYEVMLIEDKARGIKRPLAPPGPSTTSALSTNSNGPVPKIAKVDKDSEGLSDNPEVNELMADERLKNIEPKMVEAILNEVVEHGAATDWNDIAGLEGVKAIIREIIIWPMQRPDLFTGLRGPPKGILLFGPPGTGKTMFGRLIATKSESTFFNISASSLMSKWCGDGEKMVRALFQVARVKQPAVIFIDEIDSILTQRSDSEHETSRRLKTEFLIQFDGCGTKSEDKLLVIGVTNRPQELDEAARRRLVKRIYIPLPEAQGRQQLIRNLLSDQRISFTDEDYERVASLTDGYSGADMASLCKEAAYGPIRDIGHDIQNIQVDKVRPIQIQDFEHALKHVKASVASSDLTQYESWDKQFGCHV